MAAVLETKRSSVTIVKELKQAIGLISNIKLYNTDADLMLVHQTLFVKYLISLYHRLIIYKFISLIADSPNCSYS